MCVAGIAGGVAYAAVPAFLKTRFGVNEILTSLMLTYVATLFLSTLVYGPLKDPLGFNFPQSRMFGDAALLPVILDGTRLHARSEERRGGKECGITCRYRGSPHH